MKENPDFDIALKMRNFEIDQLTKRNNFLMVFQGVLFAGLVQSDHKHAIVSFMVCFTGFIVSILQVGMASGSKFWQNYWEAVLAEKEKAINNDDEGEPLFHGNDCLYKKKVEDMMNGGSYFCFIRKLVLCRFSVSKIPIYVGISFVVIWFILVLCTLRAYSPLSIPSFVVGF